MGKTYYEKCKVITDFTIHQLREVSSLCLWAQLLSNKEFLQMNRISFLDGGSKNQFNETFFCRNVRGLEHSFHLEEVQEAVQETCLRESILPFSSIIYQLDISKLMF